MQCENHGFKVVETTLDRHRSDLFASVLEAALLVVGKKTCEHNKIKCVQVRETYEVASTLLESLTPICHDLEEIHQYASATK